MMAPVVSQFLRHYETTGAIIQGAAARDDGAGRFVVPKELCEKSAVVLELTHHPFGQTTSDQMRGRFTFWIDSARNPICVRNAGRSKSDLNPRCTVNGAIARSSRESAGPLLRK